MRLQIADAAAFLAARAADHLMQQLECALGSARVTLAEAEIRIDHADEIEPREIVAFGDKLRADDDIDTPFRDVAEFLRMVSIEAMRSLDSTMVRVSGNSACASSCSRSTPGPRRQARLRRTVRAGSGRRHREAAMMTDQPLAEAMIDQPGVADGAGEAMPAGAAQRQRRIAATIEEQQRLLAPLDARSDMPARRGEMKRPRGGPLAGGRSPRSAACAGRRSATAARGAGSGPRAR